MRHTSPLENDEESTPICILSRVPERVFVPPVIDVFGANADAFGLAITGDDVLPDITQVFSDILCKNKHPLCSM